MNLNVLQQIPARIRATIYLSLAVVALILGALQVADVGSLWGFATVKALAVVGFLAAPFGITAAANVTTPSSSDSGGMSAGHQLPDVDVNDPVNLDFESDPPTAQPTYPADYGIGNGTGNAAPYDS